jgi:hypothetical protein
MPTRVLEERRRIFRNLIENDPAATPAESSPGRRTTPARAVGLDGSTSSQAKERGTAARQRERGLYRRGALRPGCVPHEPDDFRIKARDVLDLRAPEGDVGSDGQARRIGRHGLDDLDVPLGLNTRRKLGHERASPCDRRRRIDREFFLAKRDQEFGLEQTQEHLRPVGACGELCVRGLRLEKAVIAPLKRARFRERLELGGLTSQTRRLERGRAGLLWRAAADGSRHQEQDQEWAH